MNYWIVSVYVPSFTDKFVRWLYLDRKTALTVALTIARRFPEVKVYARRCTYDY